MMHDLSIGDIIKDNDPRMYGGNRKLKIIGFEAHKNDSRIVNAVCSQGHGARLVRIRVSRIKTDFKDRKYGFNRIVAVPAKASEERAT